MFSWAAAVRFDTVFFAFWLSHVPASRFEQFWRQPRGLVAGHGRVLFVDEHPDVRGKEAYAADSDEIIRRRLADGPEHRLVKPNRCMAEGGRAFIELLREVRRAPDTKGRDRHERPEGDTR